LNISQLYQDYNIPTAPAEHRHNRPGWVNVTCPFCTGNPGYHLGFNLEGGYFYCWRCGYHYLYRTLAKLLNVSEEEAKRISYQYGGTVRLAREPQVKIRRKAHRLPSDTGELQEQHRNYLIWRHFDPDQLEREWMLLGTGPLAKLDHVDYKHRILAPIIWKGEQVSFQTRDITNKHPRKYLACPQVREIIHHKHILYGRQEMWTDTGICVEGVTDVWRLGVSAFAIFGIKYTGQQVREVARYFKRVAVMFDDDPQAIKQADKLVSELQFRNVEAWNVKIKGDPASLSQEEADYIVKHI